MGQQPAAAPHGSRDGILYAISCATTSMCVAVGDDGSGPLIERWNGKAWAATRPPSTTSESIWAVSCPTTTRCFAVGEDNLGLGVLVDQWNGKTWTRSFPVVAAELRPMLSRSPAPPPAPASWSATTPPWRSPTGGTDRTGCRSR